MARKFLDISVRWLGVPSRCYLGEFCSSCLRWFFSTVSSRVYHYGLYHVYEVRVRSLGAISCVWIWIPCIESTISRATAWFTFYNTLGWFPAYTSCLVRLSVWLRYLSSGRLVCGWVGHTYVSSHMWIHFRYFSIHSVVPSWWEAPSANGPLIHEVVDSEQRRVLDMYKY